MKNFKVVIILILILTTLNSCGTIKDAFSTQKKNSTDEFLVEKKSPLVMPPEFEELPIPKIDDDIDSFNNENNSNNIEKLISNNDSEVSNSVEPNENFEKSILNQIKKN